MPPFLTAMAASRLCSVDARVSHGGRWQAALLALLEAVRARAGRDGREAGGEWAGTSERDPQLAHGKSAP